MKKNIEDLDVRRLRLRQGDVVVVTIPQTVEVDGVYAQRAMRDALIRAGHSDTPVVIADGGIEVSVISKGEQEGEA